MQVRRSIPSASAAHVPGENGAWLTAPTASTRVVWTVGGQRATCWTKRTRGSRTFALRLLRSGVLLAILAWFGVADVLWLLVPAALFIWLVRRHDEVLRDRDMADRGIAFYERGLSRLEDRWAGGGEPGERFRDDSHVYANDLDLFGRGSLFELLSLARTRTGEETLARWLTSPADPAEIQARQAASDELSSALDLRERFALAGANVRASVHTDRLLEWAQARIPVDSGLRALTWVLTGAVLLAIAYRSIRGNMVEPGHDRGSAGGSLRADARAYERHPFDKRSGGDVPFRCG